MTNLYSYDYKAKAETDEDDDAEIHFIIASEGLDDDREEDSEVVKPKAKRKPPKLCESSESDCEDSEAVEPTVNRKSPKPVDTMSMEDWDLRLSLFCQNTNFKKLCKYFIFLLFYPVLWKKWPKKTWTRTKFSSDKIFPQTKVTKCFMGDGNFLGRKILSDIFLSDEVFNYIPQ